MELEIRIHDIGGGVSRFVQKDPKQIREILGNLQPSQVFSQGNLFISDTDSMNIIAVARVTRVDFVTTERIEIKRQEKIIAVELLGSEAEFRGLAASTIGDKTPPVDAAGKSSGVTVAFVAFALADSQQVYPKFRGQLGAGVDLHSTVRRIFDYPVIQIEPAQGGLVLLNPANITRMTVYPGLKEPPRNAWLAAFQLS